MEIKKFITNDYEDIILLDKTKNRAIVLISLTNEKYNGVYIDTNIDFRRKDILYKDISYYEIDYKLYSIEDLKKAKYFTVVINNEFLLFRRRNMFSLYNFRKNEYSYISNFDYGIIHSIKSNLKFKNTI